MPYTVCHPRTDLIVQITERSVIVGRINDDENALKFSIPGYENWIVETEDNETEDLVSWFNKRSNYESSGLRQGTRNLTFRNDECSFLADSLKRVEAFDVLDPYFQRWKNRLHHSAVGAFLSLLGDGRYGLTLEIAQKWLGDDRTVADVRQLLSPDLDARCKQVRVFVSGSTAGDRVDAENLLGETVVMDADRDNKYIFAKEPQRRGDDFWIVQLRDVTPEQRTERELVSDLQNTVRWWANHVLGIERCDVDRWWERWTGGQVEVAPVRASILAQLPLTLRQLGVHDCPQLQEALVKTERAQRRREQAEATEATEVREAIGTERAKLKRLGELVAEPQHSEFLRRRVREAMDRLGYTAESVLLELVQNADDALAQAAKIAGGQLPEDVRRAMILVDGISTIDFIHFGRPINDTDGARFTDGGDRQWDQDLYFMMLLNLTAKPGEAPQEDTEPSTTGRFGLGFKSIHLISDSPSVVSGFIAFKISAGLLPEPIGYDPLELEPIEGHLATRIRLPLRTDADILETTFRRFHPIFPLLPAFARALREIVVKGGPYAWVGTFEGDPIADRWSINKETTELPDHGTWRLLRFRPGPGTAALVVGLRAGMPAPLPPEVPFLWNVAPTDEWRGCGYAVNGPFKLDPGRTHVSLGHQDTLLVVKQLGTALGKGLVSLHDALAKNSDRKYDLPVGCDEVARFTAALWKVLASGIDDRDGPRREFLRQLHGPKRGISAWMCARPVVPTELPAPFRARLAPLDADKPIERAEGGLDTADLCAAIARIDDMVPLAKDRPAVSGSIAYVLQSLGMPRCRLQPSDLFETLAKQWENLLTPERLHALRPVAQRAVWELVADPPEWYSNLVAYSVNGDPVSLDNLLLPPELNDDWVDSSAEEELRRAKFAPKTAVLGDRYICVPQDITTFQRLRIRRNVNSDTIAAWFTDDLDSERQKWALRYLLHGDLRNPLLQALRNQTPPNWLAEYNVVRDILYSLNEDFWRCEMLLAALFPERYQHPDAEPVVDRHYSDETISNFFCRFRRWWNNKDNRNLVIEKYERDAWPKWLRADGIKEGLRDNSDQHWLALLVLGICRGLGRTHDSQHRDFVTLARDNEWWDVFLNPNDTDAWMEILRTWHDRTVDRLEYALWISMIPRIYQCSHYLCRYRDLLLGADQFANELHGVKDLLAPRSNPRLTGAGVRYDVPPAPLDIGFHWVLRELVRLGIVAGDQTTDRHPSADLLRACWVPSSKVMKFLGRLGLPSLPAGSPNDEKARSISDFLATKMNMDNPHLHYSFDIPLRHVASDEHLQGTLGLAT